MYTWCTVINIIKCTHIKQSVHISNKQVTLLLDVDISTVIECINIAIIVTVNTWYLLLRLYSGNATKLNHWKLCHFRSLVSVDIKIKLTLYPTDMQHAADAWCVIYNHTWYPTWWYGMQCLCHTWYPTCWYGMYVSRHISTHGMYRYIVVVCRQNGRP